MDIEKLKEKLAKIPVIPALLVWATFLGWEYYSYESSDTSPLVQKRIEKENVRNENAGLETQLKRVKEFAKNLEIKRLEIRNLTLELDSLKATISEDLNLPDFMKSTLTEARKVGLTVLSLKPTLGSKHEYYAEQAFDLKFRGAFVQVVVFLDRLANMQKVVRVDNFEMKPLGSNMAKIVELQGTVEIKAYRYVGSKADDLGKALNSTTPPVQPSTSGASPPGGTS